MDKNKSFKKDFGNTSNYGYSREYMSVYCSWLRSLSKSKRKYLEGYTDTQKSKKQEKQELKKNRRAHRHRHLTKAKN